MYNRKAGNVVLFRKLGNRAGPRKPINCSRNEITEVYKGKKKDLGRLQRGMGIY